MGIAPKMPTKSCPNIVKSMDFDEDDDDEFTIFITPEQMKSVYKTSPNSSERSSMSESYEDIQSCDSSNNFSSCFIGSSDVGFLFVILWLNLDFRQILVLAQLFRQMILSFPKKRTMMTMNLP